MSSAVASRRGFSSFASIGFPLAFLPWTCAATCTSAHPFVAAGICRRAWIYKRWQNRRERRRPSSPRLPLHRRERNARRHVSLLRFSLCGLLSRSGLVSSFLRFLTLFRFSRQLPRLSLSSIIICRLVSPGQRRNRRAPSCSDSQHGVHQPRVSNHRESRAWLTYNPTPDATLVEGRSGIDYRSSCSTPDVGMLSMTETVRSCTKRFAINRSYAITFDRTLR